MKTFKFLAISDIHLGHRKTPSSYITSNLMKVINRDLLLELDMVIIAGDLFDHGIGYSDDDAVTIQHWLVNFLSLCGACNVAIRVLEGTPLHDRKQARHLKVIGQSSAFNVDLIYVDRVWVERNKEFSLDILYVPDEWHPDPDQTWIDVKEELSHNSINKVDLSVMHGFFEHQVPPMVSIKPHSNSRYEGITRRYVIVGHDHTPAFRGKIIAPGSFDRLAHKNSGKKGCWKVELSSSGRDDKVIFIENESAKEYITIDCSGLSFDAAIEKIVATKALIGAHIKLKSYKTDSSLALLEWAKKNYFNYNWTLELINKDATTKTGIYKPDPTELLSLNKNSLPSLLRDKLKVLNVDGTILTRSDELIKELIEC